MSKSGIYYIRNIVTNEYYVGQSMNLNERIRAHFRLLKRNAHTNQKLQESFNEYGSDNFEFEICVYAPLNALNSLEEYYTDKYGAIENGFNPYHRGVNRDVWDGVPKEFIPISEENKDKLFKMRARKDSYDSIIGKLIHMYEESIILESIK